MLTPGISLIDFKIKKIKTSVVQKKLSILIKKKIK